MGVVEGDCASRVRQGASYIHRCVGVLIVTGRVIGLDSSIDYRTHVLSEHTTISCIYSTDIY